LILWQEVGIDPSRVRGLNVGIVGIYLPRREELIQEAGDLLPDLLEKRLEEEAGGICVPERIVLNIAVPVPALR
jgi:hypothetical protein